MATMVKFDILAGSLQQQAASSERTPRRSPKSVKDCREDAVADDRHDDPLNSTLAGWLPT